MSRRTSKGGQSTALWPTRLVIALLIASLPSGGHAADQPVPSPDQGQAPVDPITDYFLHWYDRVDAAYASQPHWMTPITTVTPRLEQEYRYDQQQQLLQNGAEINNYFAGKGLELIPTETNEVLINVPAFEQRLPEGSKVKPATGFADGNFVTVKQRLLSANEENGNYILSAFMGFQAPTGITAFTNRPAWIVTPTLAGGIGWGDFDVQGTIGYTLPTDYRNHPGNTLRSEPGHGSLRDLSGRVWVTRRGVHVDRIASAWLIERFIDQAARFKFVPSKGYVPETDELRFDMFDAEFTHVGDRCTFEVLLASAALEDSALEAIAEIVHDIDLKDEKFGRAEVDGINYDLQL